TSETLPPHAASPLLTSHCDSQLSLNATPHPTEDLMDHPPRTQRLGSFSSAAMDILEEAGGALSCPSFTSMATCSSFSEPPPSEYSVDGEGYYTSMHYDCGFSDPPEDDLSGVRCLSLRRPRSRPPPPKRSSSLRKICSEGPPPPRDQECPLIQNSQVFFHREDKWGGVSDGLPDFGVFSSIDSFKDGGAVQSDYADLWLLSDLRRGGDLRGGGDPYRSLSNSSTATGTTIIEGPPRSQETPDSPTAPSPPSLGGLGSPSSGYSSQSETPTSSCPPPASVFPGPQSKRRPQVPERKSSLSCRDLNPPRRDPPSQLDLDPPSHLDLDPRRTDPPSQLDPPRRDTPSHLDPPSQLDNPSHLDPPSHLDLTLHGFFITPTVLHSVQLRSFNRGVGGLGEKPASCPPPSESLLIPPPSDSLLSPPPSDSLLSPPPSLKASSDSLLSPPPSLKASSESLLSPPPSLKASSESPLTPQEEEPVTDFRQEVETSVLQRGEEEEEDEEGPLPGLVEDRMSADGQSEDILESLLRAIGTSEEEEELESSRDAGTTEEELESSRDAGTTEEELDSSRDAGTTEEELESSRDAGTTEEELESSRDAGTTEEELESSRAAGSTDEEESSRAAGTTEEEESSRAAGTTEEEESSRAAVTQHFCRQTDFPPTDAGDFSLSEESKPEEDGVFASPTRTRTTEDLFALIHRSKRKVLGRKDSSDLNSRTHLGAASTPPPSPAVTPPVSPLPPPSPAMTPNRVSGSIVRSARKSSTSNEDFKLLLLRKGSRSESGFRMSATEILRSPSSPRPPGDPLLASPRPPRESSSSPLPGSPFLRTNAESFSPKSCPPSRSGRCRIPPPCSSSRYGARCRLPPSPMQAISEGEAENSDGGPQDERSPPQDPRRTLTDQF
ncbi:hypothetical protein JOQ06_028017, partial [Pogonophryne albipinna]